MSVSQISKRIVSRIQKECTGQTEEDVRIACERIFLDELPAAGINYKADHEAQVSSGRLDALFNMLVIEYKKPGLVQKSFDQFVSEKKMYIPALAKEMHVSQDQIGCVLLDGVSIGFFRMADDNDTLIKMGPFPVSESSIDYFILMAKSTSKKALTPKNVLKSFDHASSITKQLISALWKSLSESDSSRTKMFFLEWNRLFGQVSGTLENSSTVYEAKEYDITVTDDISARQFVFTIHTAYAIIIKHIALMILSSKESSDDYYSDIVAGHLTTQDLSREIESGQRYIRLGIRNFLEGDYFSWYTEDWSGQLDEAVHNIVNELSGFESKTAELKPEAVRDLMKKLYEGLLSKEMRHSLGEYYTPDWLAEHVLNESGFKPGMRILDPTCGSGTFLVLAINKILAEDHDVKLSDVLSHVYGFDLNPLAVISARTNYIIAIEPLLNQITSSIDIPVYLGDAIFSPSVNADVVSYYIDTEEGRLTLEIPSELLKQPSLLSATFSRINSLISQIWKKRIITLEQAETTLRQFLVDNICRNTESVIMLLRTINDLESKKWDGIWCNIIKNYLETAQVPSFDVIVGNPPWVRWSALPEKYRETIKDYCKSYNLFSSDRYVGGVESDISTMVVYSAADKWLKDDGVLAMLITRTVFKTESSEGFRSFRIPQSNTALQVLKIEDYTAIKPFDGAINKPALLLLRKGAVETKYPVAWRCWEKKKPFKSDETLDTVMGKLEYKDLVACPITGDGSPWLTVSADRLGPCLNIARKNTNQQKYDARKGVCTDLNGVYFGDLSAQGVFTNSLGTSGKTKNMKPDSARVEQELLYPVARGKEIHPFKWDWSGGYIILPQESMHAFPIEKMSSEYPLAMEYFSKYRDVLSNRSSLKRYLKNDPFYACWNVGQYTFSKYKVCWREISNRVQSCVLTEVNGKNVVPDHKIYFVGLDSEGEAYYLCAVLNAPVVTEIVLNYAESTQIGTHIFDYINIPRYDPNNPDHKRMADISKAAHQSIISPAEAIDEISSCF